MHGFLAIVSSSERFLKSNVFAKWTKCTWENEILDKFKNNPSFQASSTFSLG